MDQWMNVYGNELKDLRSDKWTKECIYKLVYGFVWGRLDEQVNI